MHDNDKKDLIPLKKNNIIQKVIRFFKRVFLKNKDTNNKYAINEKEIENTQENINNKYSFFDNIKIQENIRREFDINLLNSYRNGDIDLEEMTDEQFECLCKTYEERILQLKQLNKKRKELLLACRKRMQTSN